MMCLQLKGGSRWEFEWSEEDNAWIYQARKYKYSIEFDEAGIWIARWYKESGNRMALVTIEKEIGAAKLEMDRGTFHF